MYHDKSTSMRLTHERIYIKAKAKLIRHACASLRKVYLLMHRALMSGMQETKQMTTTETTTKTPAEKLAELKALLSQFDAAAVRQLLKASEAEKPTLLSITMDCIVGAGLVGAVVTDNVAKAVTAKARETLVLKADETASQSSVASLIRYAGAYDAALKRAGLEIVKTEAAETPAETPTEPVPEPVSEEPKPELRNQHRSKAA